MEIFVCNIYAQTFIWLGNVVDNQLTSMEICSLRQDRISTLASSFFAQLGLAEIFKKLHYQFLSEKMVEASV